MAFKIESSLLDACALAILKRGDTYGYEITRRLNQLGFTEVVEGTVYTILVRLEKSGLVKIQKKLSKMGPPRKFYSLNESGREKLRLFWTKWEFMTDKLNELKESGKNE